MKHNIFLKSIAIVLCAASLLGLVGSALGIWVMVEADLYDQTVEQVLDDNYRADTHQFAEVMAYRYAGRELGGMPAHFLKNQYSSWYETRFEPGGFGYAIVDSDGNVLETHNPEIRDRSHTLYSFPIEGNYMHLVSAEPVAEKVDIYAQGLGEGEYGIIDNVTAEQMPVYAIRISYNGGSEGISTAGSADPLGFLSRSESGDVIFQQSSMIGFSVSGDTDITRITFLDREENILYEVADERPVAVALFDPAIAGHTIQLIYDAPESPDGRTPVYKAIFYGPDGETPIEMLGSSQPIGTAFLGDHGLLNFQLFVESSALKAASNVASMVLMDQDGTILFGQAQPQLQTAAPIVTPDGLTFFSDPNAMAVELTPDAQSAEAQPASEDGAPAGEVPAEEDASEADDEETAAEPAAQTEAPSEETEPAPAETTLPSEAAPPETSLPTIPVETIPATLPTEPVIINGKPLKSYDVSTYNYYDSDTQTQMQAKVVYLPIPEYTVEVFFQPEMDQNAHAISLLRLLKQYSHLLLPLLLGSLVLLAVTTVYLCISAGTSIHSKEIRAGGLNRMPLDLYTLLAGTVITCLGALVGVTCEELFPKSIQVALVLVPLMAYAMCLVFVGFCFAFVAQCKTPGGYWWRNSLCGRVLCGGVGSLDSITGWTVQRFFPWLWRVICKFWDVCLFILEKCWRFTVFLWNKLAATTKACGRWLFRITRRAMDMLPLTWQWILGGLLLMLCGLMVFALPDGWGMVWLIAGMGFLLYVCNSFGLLYEGAIRMNKGDLETKIDEKKLIGCFRNFALDLNNLADVVVVAAQKQLQSERMKTELITNVSHDIKTPLTSIINYVDLLRKPHTEEEGEEYLEVLDRQSQRLKKLIDDLMDMSKANTGNMHVEITRLDAVESVNQALGEFADKLEKAELTPVFRHNTEEAIIMADGKLVWRVLSNLLGNAVKYAMPGTRVYLDLMNLDGRVILSLKNISRDELNVDSEELMERFVRGDDSRNTEGSGLGLNIAKSLMELQKGHLQLLVDGDLFKVTLIFPNAE